MAKEKEPDTKAAEAAEEKAEEAETEAAEEAAEEAVDEKDAKIAELEEQLAAEKDK